MIMIISLGLYNKVECTSFCNTGYKHLHNSKCDDRWRSSPPYSISMDKYGTVYSKTHRHCITEVIEE